MTGIQEPESLQVPGDILEQIEARVERTEFEDASDYVTYVLEEVLHEVEEDADLRTSDQVDEDQVEDRLKSLGYLDE